VWPLTRSLPSVHHPVSHRENKPELLASSRQRGKKKEAPLLFGIRGNTKGLPLLSPEKGVTARRSGKKNPLTFLGQGKRAKSIYECTENAPLYYLCKNAQGKKGDCSTHKDILHYFAWGGKKQVRYFNLQRGKGKKFPPPLLEPERSKKIIGATDSLFLVTERQGQRTASPGRRRMGKKGEGFAIMRGKGGEKM